MAQSSSLPRLAGELVSEEADDESLLSTLTELVVALHHASNTVDPLIISHIRATSLISKVFAVCNPPSHTHFDPPSPEMVAKSLEILSSAIKLGEIQPVIRIGAPAWIVQLLCQMDCPEEVMKQATIAMGFLTFDPIGTASISTTDQARALAALDAILKRGAMGDATVKMHASNELTAAPTPHLAARMLQLDSCSSSSFGLVCARVPVCWPGSPASLTALLV